MFELNLKINNLLFVNLLLVLACVSLACIYIPYPEGDIMEHIVASINVYKGMLPYRDFFEHHNFLLWYISGGIINLFIGNSEIIGIMNYFTYLFFLIGVFYSYKTIVQFIGNKTIGLFSLILISLPGIFLYYVYFKPDNHMIACISIAVYYFFSYIESKKRKDLIVSYFWFWVAFLFIQKALMFYPVIGGMTLYMLYKKDMSIKDFLYAIGIPFVGSLIIVGYFYYEGVLGLYWKSCFIFNSKMPEYMGDFSVGESWFFCKVVFFIAILGYVLFFKQENIYFRLWGTIFILNLIFKYFYFSPHVYYFYETYYFAVPIAIITLFRFINEYKLLYVFIIVQLQVFVIYNLYNVVSDIMYYVKFSAYRYEYEDYFVRRTNRCDEVLVKYVSIFNNNLGYYWFLRGQLDVVGEKNNFRKRDDINKLIEEHKPKIIWVGEIFDRYELYKNNKVIVHKTDINMVKKYYNKIISSGSNLVYDRDSKSWIDYNQVSEGFYELKPEYQKLKGQCIYDKENRKWKYENEY